MILLDVPNFQMAAYKYYMKHFEILVIQVLGNESEKKIFDDNKITRFSINKCFIDVIRIRGQSIIYCTSFNVHSHHALKMIICTMY